MSVFSFGSLFAGIGGIDLGLERAGMVCEWQVEIDPFCQKVLAKHWPNVERFSDVRECGKHNLAPVDLIAGGFPCHPHSTAGKRRGAEDDRNLWPEFSRVIAELRPRYVLAENVPGIVTTYIDTVLSDLESQAYTCTTFNLPACALDAPHRRERIFIVAYKKADAFCPNTNGIGLYRAQVNKYRRPNQRRTELRNQQERKRESLGKDVAHATGQPGNASNRNGRNAERFTLRRYSSFDGGAWATEPNVGRVADGIPNRVERLRALGNAVVPQVAEWIGYRILQMEKARNEQTG